MEEQKNFEVLLLPGWKNSDPLHWQSIWQERYGYQRLEQHDWMHPLRGDWSARLQEHVVDAASPVVLVAHSLGCMLTAWWSAHSPQARTKIKAALLVAPPDIEQTELRHILPSWTPTSLEKLPFPSIVVGSQDDPYCTPEQSEFFAKAWGSQWVGVGHAGHINAQSHLDAWDAGHALLNELTKEH